MTMASPGLVFDTTSSLYHNFKTRRRFLRTQARHDAAAAGTDDGFSDAWRIPLPLGLNTDAHASPGDRFAGFRPGVLGFRPGACRVTVIPVFGCCSHIFQNATPADISTNPL